MIVFENVFVQDDVQETFLRASRLDQFQPLLAFIGYDIDQSLVAFTLREVQPSSRCRASAVRTPETVDAVIHKVREDFPISTEAELVIAGGINVC